MYITPTRPAPIWLARRMRCASVERQVVQPDIDQEVQAVVDFLDDFLRNFALVPFQFELAEKREAGLDRPGRDGGQIGAVYEHVPCPAVQTLAFTGRTGLL